jgi:hypothetical protein
VIVQKAPPGDRIAALIWTAVPVEHCTPEMLAFRGTAEPMRDRCSAPSPRQGAAADAHAATAGRGVSDDRPCAAAAGIATKLGNHSFRATGITAYLKSGGTLGKAAQMANHASTRTTQLYNRQREELYLDEVERIRV